MRAVVLAFTVAVACGSCSPAFADCRREWLCNAEGACRRMPVCDSVHERTPEPSLALRPARMAGAGRGGITCEHVMRLGRGGHWSWSQACYCADRSRNPDASRPFAHIVRCDASAAALPDHPGADFLVDGRAGRSFAHLREGHRGLP